MARLVPGLLATFRNSDNRKATWQLINMIVHCRRSGLCTRHGDTRGGGFTSAEAIDLIRGLKGLDYVGFDVVEVLPDYDVAEITALLAANIVYEFLSLIALNKSSELLACRKT
jgi:hypothetical protein